MARVEQENLLVSVVVPVYNTEAYVRKCLQSILGQTYQNVEVLIIDDGSQDGSPAVCDEIAASDPRVHVVHTANAGLSAARNTGIEIAVGEYIAFVDSDDYLRQDFIKSLLAVALKYHADISGCSFYKVYGDGRHVRDTIHITSGVLTGVQAVREMILLENLAHSTTKLYKKNLFTRSKVLFPVGKLHEDTLTTYRLFIHSERIAYTDEPLYYYLQRGTGIMGSNFTRKNLAMVEACDEIIAWVKANELPMRDEALAYRLSLTICLLTWMADAEDADNYCWGELTGWINARRRHLLFGNQYVANSQKAIICAVSLGKSPYLLLRRCAHRLGR